MKASKAHALRWKRRAESDGSVDHSARIKRPYDLHFSVWISPSEPGRKHWTIDLSAWVGPEEEPTFQTTARLPAKLTLAEVEERMHGWKEIALYGLAKELEARAAFARSLIQPLS